MVDLNMKNQHNISNIIQKQSVACLKRQELLFLHIKGHTTPYLSFKSNCFHVSDLNGKLKKPV